MFRAYVVITVAWMQHNVLHLELENNWRCGVIVLWMHVLVLLLSANWQVVFWSNYFVVSKALTHICTKQVAQACNNVLTALHTHWSNTKLKYLVLLFSAAYLHCAYTYSVVSTAECLHAIQAVALLQIVAMTVAFIFY